MPLQDAVPDVENILEYVIKLYEVSVDEAASARRKARISEIRALAAWGVLNFSGDTLTNLGLKLNRDVSTLSSAVKRLIDRAKSDSVLADRMELMKADLTNNTTFQA